MNEFCKDCGGKCCYTFRVLATDAEFKTMVRYLNENNSLSDAICAALAANVKDLNGIKVITEVGERCPFLKEGKCLVYEARPEACEAMLCCPKRKEKISVAFHELRRQEKLERIVAQSGMGPKSFKAHFKKDGAQKWEPVGDDRVRREHKVPEELAFPYGEAPVTKAVTFRALCLRKSKIKQKNSA